MEIIEMIKDLGRETRGLFSVAIDTVETPQQEKVKKSLKKFYVIIGNFFFIGLVFLLLVFCIQKLIEAMLGFEYARTFIQQVWEQNKLTALIWIPGIIVGLLMVMVVTVKLLLQVYKFLTLTDLMKLYFLGEYIYLGVQYMTQAGTGKAPMLFVFEMLADLLGYKPYG